MVSLLGIYINIHAYNSSSGQNSETDRTFAENTDISWDIIGVSETFFSTYLYVIISCFVHAFRNNQDFIFILNSTVVIFRLEIPSRHLIGHRSRVICGMAFKYTCLLMSSYAKRIVGTYNIIYLTNYMYSSCNDIPAITTNNPPILNNVYV